MEGLPEFRPAPREVALAYAREVFTLDGDRRYTHFQELIEYPDGHYRVLFRPSYFVLPEGQEQPTRSQWNSLKKKMKRHNPRVFIFKAHGEVPCDGGQRCYYVDFGFFSH